MICFHLFAKLFTLFEQMNFILVYDQILGEYLLWKYLLSATSEKYPHEVFCKKGVLKDLSYFAGKHLCWSLFLKETPTQVFSCEIWEISKSTYFEKHLRNTASESNKSASFVQYSEQ